MGRLNLSSKLLKPGDSLVVSGEKFAPADALTIALTGVGGRMELGTASTDSAGKFRLSFLVPGVAKVGQYRLVAESDDGDEVASVDVVVQQGPAAEPMGTMQGGVMPAGMPMDSRPTGESLPLTRARSRIVRWLMGLLVIACLVAGVTLLREKPAHSP